MVGKACPAVPDLGRPPTDPCGGPWELPIGKLGLCLVEQSVHPVFFSVTYCVGANSSSSMLLSCWVWFSLTRIESQFCSAEMLSV